MYCLNCGSLIHCLIIRETRKLVSVFQQSSQCCCTLHSLSSICRWSLHICTCSNCLKSQTLLKYGFTKKCWTQNWFCLLFSLYFFLKNSTVSHMTGVYAKHGLWVVWMGDSIRNRAWMGYIFVEEGDSIRNGASFTIGAISSFYNLPYKQMITANA